MNNNYFIKASAFLDKLVEEMDIELFIEQYNSLDHESLSQSIPLDNNHLNEYYHYCLKSANKNKAEINQNIILIENTDTITDIETTDGQTITVIKNTDSQTINDINCWISLLDIHSEPVREKSSHNFEMYFRPSVLNIHYSNEKSNEFYELFINNLSETLASKGIVNKAKYDTFDPKQDLAA